MGQALGVTYDGAVARVALDSPETANALSTTLVADLTAALESAAGRDTRVLALSSTSAAFCGGFDLREQVSGDADVVRRFAAIQALLETLRAAPYVTVACVAGAAFGAGADLVAACDYRLAAGPARFRFPGAGFGAVLGMQRLTALVGADVALDLVLRGRVMDAAEAHSAGLATHLMDAGAFDGLVGELGRGAIRLDGVTFAAVLGATRASASDAALLLRSVTRPGIAERIESFARRR
jgi:enoyl-CoA hydratase/carnithine racemase